MTPALRSLLTLLILPAVALSQSAPYQFRLSDQTIAIKIAKAAFEQELGKEEFAKIKSFEAKRTGDKWVVYAHPYKLARGKKPPSHGGSFDIEIAAEGGTILMIRAEM